MSRPGPNLLPRSPADSAGAAIRAAVPVGDRVAAAGDGRDFAERLRAAFRGGPGADEVVPAGGVRVNPHGDPQRQLLAALDDRAQRSAIDPHASIYGGAYDGQTLGRDELERLFSRPLSTLQWHVARRRIRPDDISKAREMGLIDDRTAQHLANRSLDALERAGVEDLPREIRYTHGGPFYFRLDKDDAAGLREFKAAIGLDPDRRASQTTNAEEDAWDYETLTRMRDEGRLEVVDRFNQAVDIFSTTEIDGRRERLINPKVRYRSLDYEAHPEHGDSRRQDALDGDKVMIEAWNHDLSRPTPGTVYEVPAYESPRFNEGEQVDVHRDDTDLWRFETLPEPDGRGRARVGHVCGEVNLARRPREDIEARLRDELGHEPDEQTLAREVDAYERAKGWAKHRGMEYIRYPRDQTPAGNEAMVQAGLRDPDQDVPYSRSEDRYNGGHVIAASLGGIGEGINVTAQAEGNNQDRVARFEIGVDGERRRYFANESWHDWERHVKNLGRLEREGLTLAQLEAQGFTVSDAMRDKYGLDERVPFEVQTAIRSWYEDEATETEAADTRHSRELARFTSTRLRHPETGEVLGELLMANYNVGSSDGDYGHKMQMLFDAGLLDGDGGYANDADMSAFAGSGEAAPDVSGAGTLNERLPSEETLRAFARSESFRRLWGPP